MYTQYFGLTEKPFSIVPNPRFLYMSEQHREALAHLHYGIQEGEGFILITGEVGAGKTTLCKCLLERIPKKTNVAYILNSKVNVTELLASICDELGINYEKEAGQKHLTDKIYHYLLQAHAANKNTVLIIDEAQNLHTDVLEQIRLLTNLETNEKKLLQIILLGQPELREILQRTDLRQLAQRVTARYHLGPLSKEEVPLYVNHRITVAGGHPPLFNDAASRKLYVLTQGIPRLINLLCDRALLAAYSENKRLVDKKTLLKAAKETIGHIAIDNPAKNPGRTAHSIDSQFQHSPSKRRSAMAFPVLMLTAIGLGILIVSGTSALPLVKLDFKRFFTEQSNELVTDHHPGNINSITALNNKTKAENSLAPTIIYSAAKPEKLLHPESYSTQQTKMASYRALLSAWDIDEPNFTDKGLCLTAQENGLRCFNSKGNMGSLRRLNRPAALRLFTDSGDEYYILLAAISAAFATVEIAGLSKQIAITELEQQWSGDFLLLWKAPESFSTNLENPSAAHQQWLRAALSKVNLLNQPELKNFTYIAPLKEQIKDFQKSQGLNPDGIAGEHTLILLNTALGLDVPLLNSQL